MAAQTQSTTLKVKCPAFLDNGVIPSRYSYKGLNINPELIIENIPDETKSLALIMEDPDAPKGTFVHWLMWNIPVMRKIEENSYPGMQGKNGHHENKYYGPNPPEGTHHYHFRVYALDVELDLPAGTEKEELLEAMESHVIGEGELVGTYKN